MNSLKNLIIVFLLAVVGYGVYVSTKKERPASPPPGVQGWSNTPLVEMPGAASAAVAAPLTAPPVGFGANSPPPAISADSSAPTASSAMTAPGTTAPPPSNPPSGMTPTGTSGYDAAAANPPLGAPPANTMGASPSGATNPPPTMGASPPPPSAPSMAVSLSQVRPQFVEFMNKARSKLEAGDWKGVHGALTMWYDDPRLMAEESVQLTELLDQIAGTAIYSRQSILDEAYTVQPGDNLQRIADSYNVPWQLLAKINGVRDPQNLRAGQALKVVRGPFQAVISLDSHKLTLMVNSYYAGHFAVGVGTDHPQLEGSYVVKDKTINPEYYFPDGTRVPSGDPRNPLGKRWINLGDRVGIHGTNDPRNIGSSQAPGSVCLSDRDIDDVYDILSVGSRVIIRR